MCGVSIIIPAYNVENYIERCVQSCIAQTFKNIEIIIVNDGSTDKTLNILYKLKDKDNRIVIINQKNSGSMEARKSGWKIARGKYILFVDGDDYINKNTIEVLYKNASENDYDIVCYKFFIEYKNGIREKESENQIKRNKQDKLIKLLFEGKINHNMWSKLIKKDFVVKNNIEFPSDFSYGEDMAFVYTLSMYNPKFNILNEYLYNYCKREGSLDSGINEKTSEILKALMFIEKQMKKNNIYNKYKEEFEYLSFVQAYYTRKDYIFNNKDYISKTLFKNWKILKIKINIYNNRFYKNLYKNESRIAIFIEEVCKNSYYLGRLYYKVFKYTNKLTKRKNI